MTNERAGKELEWSPGEVFASEVLAAVEGVRRRRRRRLRAAGALVALAVIGGVAAVSALRTPRAQGSVELADSDFAWLDEVGTEPSAPSTLLLPEVRDRAEGSPFTPYLLVDAED